MKENAAPSYARMIAVSGVMGAVTILLGVTHLGFITLPGVSLTIMQVPVIVAAILEGPIAGLIVGAIFGVFSLIQAAIPPVGAFDPLFLNPLISIAPRLLIGPASFLVYRALKGKESAPRITVASIAAALAGSLTNTCLVLPLLKVFADAQGITGLSWPLVGTIALTNGLPEAGLSAFIATATVLSWKLIALGRTKARLSEEEGRKG